MTKYITLSLAAILLSSIIFAQEKVHIHSINTAGIATGKGGGFGVVQTVNGVGSNNWFTGIGVGLDYYRYKTIPLFVDGRISLGRSPLFAFGDLGYNFPSKGNTPGKDLNYYSSYHFTGGVYNELGIGYKILLARKTFLLLSSGYSYKEVNNKVGVQLQCLTAPCFVDYSKYKYGYGRVVVKAGVSF